MVINIINIYAVYSKQYLKQLHREWTKGKEEGKDGRDL